MLKLRIYSLPESIWDEQCPVWHAEVPEIALGSMGSQQSTVTVVTAQQSNHCKHSPVIEWRILSRAHIVGIYPQRHYLWH